MHWKNTKGFTLIELLVVIAIIAVLAAILFPVFARAREKARQSTCTSNQRQIAAAIMMHAQDHEEQLPNSTTVWADLNLDAGILICPTKGKVTPNGYDYNSDLSDWYSNSLGDMSDPTAVWMTVDGNTNSNGVNVATDNSQFDPRHSNKVIASFVDGHVTSVGDVTNNLFIDGTRPSFSAPVGIGLWYLADNGLVVSGTSVASWRDKSGSHLTAKSTGAAAPTLLTGAGGLNNLPVVTFNGSSNVMTGTPPKFLGMDALIVGRWLTGCAANTGLFCLADKVNQDYQPGDTSIIWASGYTAGNASGSNSRWRGGSDLSPLTVTINTWHVYGNSYAGGLATMRDRGTTVISSTGGFQSANTPTYFAIGARAAGNSVTNGFGKCSVAEIMIFKNALSNSERQRCEQYLEKKYNL